jgi:hypothetical protein
MRMSSVSLAASKSLELLAIIIFSSILPIGAHGQKRTVQTNAKTTRSTSPRGSTLPGPRRPAPAGGASANAPRFNRNANSRPSSSANPAGRPSFARATSLQSHIDEGGYLARPTQPNLNLRSSIRATPEPSRGLQIRPPSSFSAAKPSRANATVDLAGGATARFDGAGRLTEVHSRDMSFSQGPGGSRRFVSEKVDRILVVDNQGHGFVQRAFVSHGGEYFQRTHFTHGRPFVSVYRPYLFFGVVYPVYVPLRYYRPAFYRYAYRSWALPVVYHWGWYRAPWYGYFGPAFSPYGSYPGPRAWLTDYLISSELQDAFESQPDQQQVSNASPITPELKEAISEEIAIQLGRAQHGPPPPDSSPLVKGASLPIFDNSVHTLLVSNDLNVASNGQPCAVTKGDILQMPGISPAGPLTYVSVRVAWSIPSDCPMGSTIDVAVDQLQEMQNQMRSVLDQGLAEMQASSGQNGMTSIPPDLIGSKPTSFTADTPEPEPNVEEELKQQALYGLRMESQIAHQP